MATSITWRVVDASFGRIALVSGVSIIVLALLAAYSTADAQSRPAAEPDIEVTVTAPGTRADVQQTTAGPVRGYQAITSGSATKTDTPLTQIPQSVQVIPRKVIDDQGAITQGEAMRNVSSLQPVPSLNFGQIGPNLRGFPADRMVDGLPNYYDPGARDLLNNVERLEVLKGPSSILYQGGPTPIGGVVNVVSKLPTAQRFATFGVTAGTQRYLSSFFDINQPLNKDGTVLLRFTGQYEGTRSHIETIHRRSFSLNPTLTFTNNAGTSLTIQGFASNRKQQEYSGLPATGTLDRTAFSIRRKLFPGDPTVPDTVSRIMGVTLKFDHVLNETWSTSITGRLASSRMNEPAPFIFQFAGSNRPIAGSNYSFWNGHLQENTTEVSFSGNLVGKFDFGPSKNRLLFSLDYNRVRDVAGLNGEFQNFVDFANPVFPRFFFPSPGPFSTFTSIDNLYQQMGATVQLQSSWYDRLHILAGAKLAHVDILSNEFTTGGRFNTKETKVLPRLGVVFEVFKGVSLFAGYSEGLRAVPFFNGPTAPKPEESRQMEAGIKLDTGFGLSGSMAVFEITRRNVAVANPAAPGQNIQSGEQRSRGVEADLIWQPFRGFSVLAAVSHLTAEVTKDTNVALIGQPLVGVPRTSGRLWANYEFLDGPLAGLSVGAGLTGASKQNVVLGDVFRTPGYVTIDARIAYKIQNWNVSVTAKNLANAKYFEPYPYFDGRVAPGAPRSVYATLSTTF